MMDAILGFLSQPGVGPTITLLALAWAVFVTLVNWRKDAKSSAENLPQIKFATGTLPFGPKWRQGVLDIRVDDPKSDFVLEELVALRPRGLLLALGFNGDTNRGADEATAATRHIIHRTSKTHQWAGGPKFASISFDVFYRHIQGYELASTTIAMRVSLRPASPARGRIRVYVVETFVPGLPS